MENQLQRRQNPSGASVGLLVGFAALGGLAWWMLREDGEEGEEEPKVPDAVFDPVNTEALTISADCQTVVVGSNWTQNIAFPQLQQQVQQMGRGMAIYPQSMLDRSIDAAVREVLAPYGACIDEVLWMDKWQEMEPFPFIEPIYNAATARQKIDVWQNAWSLAWGSWAVNYQQLAVFVDALRTLTRNMYMANLGVNLNYQPVDTGQFPAGLTQSDKDRLLTLGYDLDQNVLVNFQNHYNLVKNFQTSDQWEQAQLTLIEDNTLTPATKDAIVDAEQMQEFYGPWMGLVETAANA